MIVDLPLKNGDFSIAEFVVCQRVASSDPGRAGAQGDQVTIQVSMLNSSYAAWPHRIDICFITFITYIYIYTIIHICIHIDM